MNFLQRKIVRESTQPDNMPDGLSNIEPADENLDVQLGELASEDGQLDALANEGEVLATDIVNTETSIDNADEAIENGEEKTEEAIESTEIAQESIRRRWCIDRTALARESYRRSRGMTKAAREGWKETLKDLYKTFIEYCKTVIAKTKDLKLRYLNVGKSAQARSKKYDAVLRKLGGKKKKEEVGGGWISKLSLQGKFDLNTSIQVAKEVTAGKAKAAISALAAQAAGAEVKMTKAAAGEDVAFSKGNEKIELFGKAASNLSSLPQFEAGEASSVMALPGNAYVQSGTKKIGDVEFTAIAFSAAGDSSEDKNIPTPDVGALNTANTALNAIGKSFEDVLKDFRSYDAEVEKLQQAASKASAAFDKAIEDDDRKALSAARTAADQAVRNYQVLNRAVSYTANTVIAGLSGFIGAGIGAYEKQK